MNSESLGLLAAFTTVISWGFGTIAFALASRLVPPAQLNKTRLLLALFIVTILASLFPLRNPLHLLTAPNAQSWLWLGLSGLVGLSIGDYFLFHSLKILGARRGSMFATISPGASLLLAYILLGETLNPAGLLGMGITITGIAWMLGSQAEKQAVQQEQQGSYLKGIIFGIASACCQGFGLVLSKKGMIQYDVSVITALDANWIRLFTGYGFIFITGLLRSEDFVVKQVLQQKNAIRYIVAGTILGPVIGISLSIYAASSIEVSLAQTILSMTPVSVLIISAILYREKLTVKSIAAALVAVLGVLVLVWRDELYLLFL